MPSVAASSLEDIYKTAASTDQRYCATIRIAEAQ